MLAIEGAVLLDGVICEMDHLVSDVIEVEVVGGGADVALTEPVGSHDAVEASDEHVVPDVEFSAFVQQWILDVFLDDVGLVIAIVMFLLLLEDVIQLVNLIDHHDTVASVRQLPRLHNPDIF